MTSLAYISLVRQADHDKYFLLKVGKKESTMFDTEILQLLTILTIGAFLVDWYAHERL